MQLQACSLYILNLYSSLRAAIAIWDLKALLPKHLYLPVVSIWSSKRCFSLLQILPFWEDLEWVAGATKSVRFSIKKKESEKVFCLFFLPFLVLHSWLFLQTCFMLLMLGNYSKWFCKQTAGLSFFQLCLHFPDMLMNEFWNITENNIENKA